LPLLAKVLRNLRTVEKYVVEERSLSSRREQVAPVRVLHVHLTRKVAVQHTLFVLVHISNAHQRR
jgi:hypothetical protein